MKFAIVLLFLPSLTFAQYPQSQSQPDAYFLQVEQHGPGDLYAATPQNGSIDLYRDVFLPRLLADWEAYKRECSSSGHWHISNLPTMRWTETNAYEWTGEYVTDTVWIASSAKPTFPGFMQYLTTRLERKGVKP